MMKKIYPNLLGLVLCGGLSRRMGGSDKGLLTFNQQAMVTYPIAALQPCQQLLISANRNQQQYKTQFNLPVRSDADLFFHGPLAGMLEGLKYAKEQQLQWMITAPCDAPFITSAYVHRMMEECARTSSPILMARDKQFRQPVFSLLNVYVLKQLECFLQGQQNKILHFYQSVGYETVFFSDSQLFTNINTPGDMCLE